MRKGIKVISTAKYLPKKVVTAEEMDEKIRAKSGWVAKKSGVLIRHFVEDETAPMMGAIVANQALEKVGLTMNDIDALIATSGTPTQPIPSNSALILEAMGELNSGITSFDINSTCLSFVVGLDTISYPMIMNRYKRVLIVSSEIASVGLNYNEKESCALMGDGAAAVILERDEESESEIIAAHFETYASGARFAEIRGGGNAYHAIRGNAKEDDFYFNMNGKQIFKQASKLIEPFLDRFNKYSKMNINEFDLVIPHQASKMSLGIIQKKLKLSNEQFLVYLQDHGNLISASIPTGLHIAIEEKRIKRGDKVLLIGTSAGFSIGALALKY